MNKIDKINEIGDFLFEKAMRNFTEAIKDDDLIKDPKPLTIEDLKQPIKIEGGDKTVNTTNH